MSTLCSGELKRQLHKNVNKPSTYPQTSLSGARRPRCRPVWSSPDPRPRPPTGGSVHCHAHSLAAVEITCTCITYSCYMYQHCKIQPILFKNRLAVSIRGQISYIALLDRGTVMYNNWPLLEFTHVYWSNI